jgi:RNA polymerase sigma factor
MSRTLDERVESAKTNNQEMEWLMNEYQPFILGRIYTHGFGDRNEEISVALGAFYESIQTYTIKKGSFLAYAGKVIQCRLIDYQRRLMRQHRHTIITQDVDTLIDAQFTARQQSIVDHREVCRSEITDFTTELAAWGITLDEVAASTPRHVFTKDVCRRALGIMLADNRMVCHIRAGRKLPLKELALKMNVSIKVLERHRRYLVAAWLIRQGDYTVLKEYVPFSIIGMEDSR